MHVHELSAAIKCSTGKPFSPTTDDDVFTAVLFIQSGTDFDTCYGCRYEYCSDY